MVVTLAYAVVVAEPVGGAGSLVSGTPEADPELWRDRIRRTGRDAVVVVGFLVVLCVGAAVVTGRRST